MDIEENILVQRYETLLYNKESIYFDIEEFEIIISFYMEEERYADALEALIHAELCYPDDVELTLDKVKIMMYLDNFDRAFELLLTLEDKACDLFELHLYKGHIHVMNGEVENAVKEFELAFEKSSGLDEEELQYIPNILMEEKYFSEALVFLHKFIDSGNAGAKVFFNAGYCYEHLSDMEKAEKYYEQSLDEDPFDEKTWIALGVLHLNCNNTEKAMDAFEFALSINKDNAAVILCKSAAFIKAGEYGKAIECILGILTNAPDDADALYNLGGCYEKEQNMEDAEQCYSEAIRQEPEFALPYWGLSKILYSQGDIEGAVKVIDKAIEIEPDNEEYLYFRGQCFISLSSDRNMLEAILHNINPIRESEPEKFQDSEFINKHKKAAFFYNVGDLEKCCQYLLESVMINNEGFEMFFSLFPEAKDDAYIINYLGKHLK
ncbi:MAG: tetratricopeptide repeat protein [Prevotellaceae bacterium]|jgi:tetratricopeptide (TPR) repeat protein|nr:tetratricopeptide repeat protein [Prevotellaceae bacterium]